MNSIAKISDSGVRELIDDLVGAVNNYEAEIFDLENKCSNLESTIESMETEQDKLLEDISELNQKIIDLEQALAEAYLTSTN